MSIRVTVWHEYRHEKTNENVRAVYPDGMHIALANHLQRSADLQVRTATLDEPEHGLSDDVIKGTDVMVWWGHGAHADVKDEIAEKVKQRVLEGMGLIVLHSAHHSKPFLKLMGTTCNVKWRVADDREILWVTKNRHPITAGIDDHFIIPHEEMYGECFDVPEPLETVLISSFTGGEVFRSGLTWSRGAGKIFYFRPGHETMPTYHDANVLRVITNAVHWAAPAAGGLVPPGSVNAKLGWLAS